MDQDHARFPALAVIGAACRLPGGVNSLADLHGLLMDGRDAVTTVPPDRFDLDRFVHPDRKAAGRSCTSAAGVIEGLSRFDAGFFGISRKEAEAMDPQQRLVLEMAWEAFEDAGIPPSTAAGSRTAVFIGAASTDMGLCRADDPCVMGPYAMTGTSLSIIANRVSYVFDLHGPSMTIDTACSSSLVALHQACRALLDDDLPMALAGGVNVLLSPFPFVGFSKAHMLSKDGRCKVFDASGNGYVRAEGGGVVIIKRLDRALADGDRVHAVIRATGVNSDGRTTGIALPNAEAQRQLLREVYDSAGLDPARLAYVEAHGTGTAVGDPIETSSIGAVLGTRRPAGKPLLVGSIKGNVGHLETGSGMAGLFKALLVLGHGVIPPNIHLQHPNPAIDFSGLNIAIPTEATPLPEVDGPPLVGVNSFGFGGTNAHVVLEAAPQQTAGAVPGSGCPPLTLSARNLGSLARLAGQYADLLSGAGDERVREIAASAATRRDHLDQRLVVTADGADGLRAALELFRETPQSAVGENWRSHLGEVACSRGDGVFVFSGNGCQWPGMGSGLFGTDEEFTRAILETDAHLAPLQGWSVAERMRAPRDAWGLERTEVAQPMLFAVQVALARSLMAMGFSPRAVYGHSVGEVAAAHVCGALSLPDACTVIHHRSSLQGRTFGSGGMAAVSITPERALALASESEGAVELAAVNSASSVTLAGDMLALRRIEQVALSEKVFFKILPVDYPFHSRFMDGLRAPLLAALAGIAPGPARIRFVSTVTGLQEKGESLGPEYWWGNIRRPVLFLDATRTLLDLGARIFLELGAHGVLQYYLRDTIRASGLRACPLPTLQRDEDDARAFGTAWRQAYVSGWPMDFSRVFPGRPAQAGLPLYPWDREQVWADSTPESAGFLSSRAVHPLLGWRVAAGVETFEGVIDTQLFPWLSGHVVGETVLFPAAGFIELCHAAARLRARDGEVVEIVNLDIRRPLALGPSPARKLRVGAAGGVLSVSSRTLMTTEDWVVHARARVLRSDAVRPASSPLAPAASDALPVERLYEAAREVGLAYEPPFKAVTAAWRDGEGVLVELGLADQEAGRGMHLAPPLVDGAFQALFLLLAERLPRHKRATFLPAWFGRMTFYSPGELRFARARLEKVSTRSVLASFELLDARGGVLAVFSDCRFRRVGMRLGGAVEPGTYRTVFRPNPHPSEPVASIAPAPSAMARELSPFIDRLAGRLKRSEYYDVVLPLCRAATAALAHELLRPLGATGPFTLSQGLERGLLRQENIPYLVYILELLASQGLARIDAGFWTVESESQLPPSVDLWRTVLADFPAHLPEAVLVGRIGLHLRDLLRGKVHHDSILGTDHSGAIEHFFANSPSVRLLNETAAALVRESLDHCPAGRRMRILEVGAAPGGLLTAVAPVLDPARCDYVVSDRDESALERLHALRGDTPGVTFEIFDMERPGPLGDFDLVLAGQSLHAADSVDDALRGCLSALAPRGVLICLERTPSSVQDMIQGTDPWWWERSPSPEEPASRQLPLARWVEAFERVGFVDVRIVHESCEGCQPDMFMVLGAKPEASVAASSAVVADPDATWIILAGEQEPEAAVARSLGMGLELGGGKVHRIAPGADFDPCDPAAWTKAFETLSGSGRLECVHLFGLDFRPDLPAESMSEVALRRLDSASAMVGAWEEAGRPACRFWLVSGGCQSVPGEDAPAVMSQASLWGFGRVLQNEIPALGARLVDVSVGEAGMIARGLVRELLSPGPDQEIVLAGDRRYRVRVEPFDSCPTRPSSQDVADSIRLVFDAPGKLDRLYWRQVSRRLPGSGEVQVQTMAVGLNFRDVMWAMGMLPDEALEGGFSGPTMGLECSGIVSAVGDGVRDFQVGDEVICFAPSCFGSFVITREDAVVMKPAGLSFEEAATIPVAFFTAFYALKHLASATRGERLLVHGAAGGVGLAAIQIATHLGLEVFATAGSEEKRDFLRLLGIQHVFDSRSLDFDDQVRSATGGEGVEIVLNSLHGEAIERGLSLLRPFGRFLELGKRDFYADSPMYLRFFRNNISYFGIDVDQLLTARPAKARELFAELMDLFAAKILRPLPHRIFPRASAVEAFRTMQQARHIGKLVVTFDEYSRGVRPAPIVSAHLPVSQGASYLVTGGLGGFGLKAARRLVRLGARHILLLGRGGMRSEEAAREVASMRADGAHVHVLQADVSDEAALRRVLDLASSLAPPIRGVIHAAAVLADAVIVNLNQDRIRTAWDAKARGAWNLHACTLDLSLDFFVLFSSATTLLGNPGQANYVAANCALETLAEFRRSKGLPALAVGWGPVSDVGMLARDPRALDSLKSILGVTPLTSEEALDMLEMLHWRGVTSPAVVRIDWSKVRRLPAGARFEAMRQGDRQDGEAESGRLLDAIRGLSREEGISLLAGCIAEETASILRIPLARINLSQPVSEFGMDSLMVVELGIALEERLGLEASPISLAGGASILSIAERFLEAFEGLGDDEESHLVRTMQSQHGAHVSESLSSRLRTESTGKEGSDE